MSKPIYPDEERPFTVALSAHEVYALVKWNCAQMRRITKIFGQEALQLQAKSIFPQGTRLNQMKDACKAKVEQHFKRANGLSSILKK